MQRAWEARLEHFNVILWVAGRNECFLSLGGLDYEKAQLESVCRVGWILNVPRMRSGDYYPVVQGSRERWWESAEMPGTRREKKAQTWGTLRRAERTWRSPA